MAQPRIGDIVLYRDADEGPDAPALVTAVNDESVSLAVFYPDAVRLEHEVIEDQIRDADVPARTWRPRG